MNEPRLHDYFLALLLVPVCAGVSACSSDDRDGVVSSAGGAAAGGAAAGGAAAGGAAAGGAAAGGAAAGGAAAGGAAAGGAAAGGAAAGGALGSGGGASNDQYPADTSAEGIAAFLATGSYESWAHKPAPYPPTELPFHGDLMLAYFNEVALATHDDAAIYAMTVKEFYDASGTRVGIAAALKTSEEVDLWTYYCTEDPPGNNCANDPFVDYPVYEVEQFYTGCALCHTDAIISPLP